MHSTSQKYFEEYRELLTKLDNKEPFINPAEINEFFKDKLPKKSFSLLTIDDGFQNNLKFAEEVLKPLNIKAIFLLSQNS